MTRLLLSQVDNTNTCFNNLHTKNVKEVNVTNNQLKWLIFLTKTVPQHKYKSYFTLKNSSHTFLNGSNCRIFNKINKSIVARNAHIDKCKPRDVRKRALIGSLAFWIYDWGIISKQFISSQFSDTFYQIRKLEDITF